MLSILIPCRHYDCGELVNELDRQCRDAGILYEILVGEDNGETPMGRAANRNQLVKKAQYDYLLFIDADALVCRPDYIRKFWNNRDEATVIVGGLETPQKPKKKGMMLRWKYEEANKNRENFTVFNTLIQKTLFLTVHFNEEICKSYGHEDTLLGVDLQKNGILPLYINNPLIHNGLDTSEMFLKKSETAVKNLIKIGEPLLSKTSLGKTFKKLKKWHATGLVKSVFSLSKKQIRRNLLSENPSLSLFQFYKLGYFLENS